MATATAAAASTSTLYIWGNNGYGKLGVGEGAAELKPQRLPYTFPSRTVKAVASGRSSAVITETGDVFIWGDVLEGNSGVLRHSPTRVPLPPRCVIRELALGRSHALALSSHGTLYSWGLGTNGRLGHGNTLHRDSPTAVRALEEAGVAICALAAGAAHSLAADAEGTVWSWGCALGGCLGRAADADALEPHRIVSAQLTPSEVPDGVGRQVSMLSAGAQTSAAVTVDGRLFTWGLGAFYVLGNGTMDDVHKPTELKCWCPKTSNKVCATIKKVSLGSRHAAAVDGEDGTLYTWGYGAHGQLGHGDGNANHKLPTPVQFFEGRPVVAVSTCHCNGAATAAITEDGSLFMWGAGHNALGAQRGGEDAAHEDGMMAKPDIVTPRTVEGGWHRDKQCRINSVALGAYHALLSVDNVG